uniref:Uncharacterized protein n=1 Tax=Arundo donax TaxID=35708 RepID=A0A0A9FNN4_ARUDO
MSPTTNHHIYYVGSSAKDGRRNGQRMHETSPTSIVFNADCDADAMKKMPPSISAFFAMSPCLCCTHTASFLPEIWFSDSATCV